MKKHSRIKSFFINLGLVILLIIGVALIFNNQIRNYLMKENTETYTVSKVTREEVKTNLDKEANFDFEQVKSVSLESVLRAQLEDKVLPVIGGVAVPSVEINLPIFKGLDNTALMYGAGTFHPEQQMGEGNYALASHRIENADILFSNLHQVNLGDKIYLTDLENIYTYEITVSKRIEPTQVEVVDPVPGETLVTLITCGEASGVTRWLVQGELVKQTTVEEADKKIADIFEMKQKTF